MQVPLLGEKCIEKAINIYSLSPSNISLPSFGLFLCVFFFVCFLLAVEVCCFFGGDGGGGMGD